MKKKWLNHGLLNTLEHFITRFSDAFVSLLLVWALTPEIFGQLSIAQAVLAPFLILFLSPETVLYRDYSKWKEKGPLFIYNQLDAFRRFSWLKLLFGFFLSFLLAFILKEFSPSYSEIKYIDLLFSFFWGVVLFIAPQLLGPDREFLRLELKFIEVNILTILQKTLMVLSTLCASFLFSGNIAILFILSLLSFFLVYFIQLKISFKLLKIKKDKNDYKKEAHTFKVIFEALFSFSLWNHFIGVIHGWVQTLSLMLIGFTSISAREIGLFSTVLKLGNFSLLIPTALGQLFSIWIGRRVATPTNLMNEKRKVLEYSLFLILLGALQVGVLFFVCPYLFQFFSQGRWSDSEISIMLSWVFWIFIGNLWIGPVFLTSTWINLRTKNKNLFFRAYLPFAVVSFIGMFYFVQSENLLYISQGQVFVMFAYFIILNIYFLAVSPKKG